jgi:lysophospholipase L1-like esterase
MLTNTKLLLATHPTLSVCLLICFGILITILFVSKKNLLFKLVKITSFTPSVLTFAICYFHWDSYSVYSIRRLANSTELPNKILFIGDSHVFQSNFPKGFTTKLRTAFPDTQFLTMGYSGETIGQIEKEISQNFSAPETTVIIFCGTNDSILNIPLENSLIAMRSLLKKIHSTKYIITPHTLNLPNTDKATQQLADILKETKNINRVINWYSESINHQNILTQDGIHLNGRGHSLLAKEIVKTIKRT